jgi:hypothetical protein
MSNNKTMDWSLFMHDIITFRTHVWWGQVILLVINLYLIMNLKDTVYFLYLLISLIIIVGSIVDISAHEWYH